MKFSWKFFRIFNIYITLRRTCTFEVSMNCDPTVLLLWIFCISCANDYDSFIIIVEWSFELDANIRHPSFIIEEKWIEIFVLLSVLLWTGVMQMAFRALRLVTAQRLTVLMSELGGIALRTRILIREQFAFCVFWYMYPDDSCLIQSKLVALLDLL